MYESLRQKKGGEFRNYEIVPTGLKVEFKVEGSYNQQIIKFENIAFDEVITKEEPSPLGVMLFLSVIFNLFLIVAQFHNEVGTSAMSTISIGCVVLFSMWGNLLFSIKKVKLLTGNATIPFWYFKKHVQEVDQFIETLKSAKREYFRKTYLKIEEYEDLDAARQRMIWLKTQGIISSDELSEWILLIEAKRLL